MDTNKLQNELYDAVSTALCQIQYTGKPEREKHWLAVSDQLEMHFHAHAQLQDDLEAQRNKNALLATSLAQADKERDQLVAALNKIADLNDGDGPHAIDIAMRALTAAGAI